MISYYDVLLRASDVALLNGPFWLNDQIVEFYFEYLRREVLDSEEVCLIGGATTFFILNGVQNDVKIVLDPLKLKQKKIIMFAVNDNPDITQVGGGTHWSLLVFDRRDDIFLHLDSADGANNDVATILASKCCYLVEAQPDCSTKAAVVPTQMNSYDCALYMLKFAELLGKHVSVWSHHHLHILNAVNASTIAEFRKQLLALIHSKGKV